MMTAGGVLNGGRAPLHSDGLGVDACMCAQHGHTTEMGRAENLARGREGKETVFFKKKLEHFLDLNSKRCLNLN